MYKRRKTYKSLVQNRKDTISGVHHGDHQTRGDHRIHGVRTRNHGDRGQYGRCHGDGIHGDHPHTRL